VYWIYFAIIALILFGLSRTLYIIASRSEDIPEWLFLITLNTTATIVSTIILISKIPESITFESIIVGIFLGLLSTSGAISLYRANATCSPSLVNIILGMNFIIPLTVGIFMLNERLNIYQYVGLIFVILTVILSTIEGLREGNRKFKISGILYALITFFTWGLLGVIIKIAELVHILHSYITCLLFMYIVETISLVVYYRRHISYIRNILTYIPGIIAGIFSCVGSYLAIICYAIGEISITSLILRFSFIIPTLFSIFHYREFGLYKLFLIVLSIISIVLLSL